MRFKLFIETEWAAQLIEGKQQYDIYIWLKQIIDASPELKQLSDQTNGSFFTFSDIQTVKNKPKQCYFYLSFLPFNRIEELFVPAITGKIFEKTGNDIKFKFNITDIEPMPEPEFTNHMALTTLSPIILAFRDHTANKYSEFMYPKGERYCDIFMTSLQEKYKTYNRIVNNSPNIDYLNYAYNLEMSGKTKSRLTIIQEKSTEKPRLRSYAFDFKIKAPKELIRIGYYIGFGDKNEYGFGCCEII